MDIDIAGVAAFQVLRKLLQRLVKRGVLTQDEARGIWGEAIADDERDYRTMESHMRARSLMARTRDADCGSSARRER